MARLLLIFSFLILSFSQMRAQQFLDPSFEGTYQPRGRLGPPWEFYQAGSSPNHQPGILDVTLPAYDGEKYAGMVVQKDRITEYVGQQMIPALQANSHYEFTIWLANSPNYDRWNNSASIRVLGVNPDEEPYVFWHSPYQTSPFWTVYTVRFKTPDKPVQYLYFQSYYGRDADKAGNILLDHIGPIKKLPEPNVDLGNDTTLCAGDTLVLTASTDSSLFEWKNGSGDRQFIVREPGTYWVEATLGAIRKRDSIIVDYGYLPSFDLGPDTALCYGFELPIRIWKREPTVAFQWNTGHRLADLTIKEAGFYQVLVSNGPCQISDSIEVSYRDCDLILTMPNIISPNSDGINDTFVPIEIKDVHEPKLIIYDRWGKQVYMASNLNIGWQGESSSGPVPEGVYYWVLHYSDLYGEQYIDKGSLSLVR